MPYNKKNLQLHLGESSTGTSAINKSEDEQRLLSFYGMASIDNSSKRNDLTAMEVACSSAKKCKLSQDMQNGVAVAI